MTITHLGDGARSKAKQQVSIGGDRVGCDGAMIWTEQHIQRRVCPAGACSNYKFHC